jgi:putative ATP-dependent endonuclease of OLD family
MYYNLTNNLEKNLFQLNYRQYKENFKETILKELNDKLEVYDFAVKHNSKSNLETDLMLLEDNISIDNKGKGIQCFIKTEFALSKFSETIDVILLEEPENHLSHINMKRLISDIRSANNKQLFITTHSNMISTRLNLKKSILLNSNINTPILLNDISETTAKFFMKAPDNNILDMVLSKKVILVEGDAEFILMETFFEKIVSDRMEKFDVCIISVDGTSFKRYLEVSKALNIKTAVIRDNDRNYTVNCLDNYSDFVDGTIIQVFSDPNNDNYTFEVCLYNSNTIICDNLFSKGRRSLSVLDFMLKNKADSAFQLLDSMETQDTFIIPQYIIDAVLWIKE